MLSQRSLDTALATSGLAVTRGLLAMTTLAMAIVLAAGCDGRPAAPEGGLGTGPASSAAQHQAAHAPAPEEKTMAGDEHGAHAPTGTAPPVLPATPWASDAPLREGMRRMHRAVEALGHAEHDHLDAAQTAAAAQQVEDAANYMITNCKLPPEPDAALHGVLATLMTGATALKRDPANIAPVASMREALALYPRMFADATWVADTGSKQ